MENILFLIPFLQTITAPFTKVEESFPLHALHDLFSHRLAISKYDHLFFPGAVPRSFIPAIAITALAYPVVSTLSLCGLLQTKLDIQITLRCVLAVLNVSSLFFFKRTLARIFSRKVAVIWTVLMFTSFHIPFYLSRTLPNFLAFPLVSLAISRCLLTAFSPTPANTPHIQSGVIWPLCVFLSASIIVRSELFLFVPIYFLQLLAQGRINSFTHLRQVTYPCVLVVLVSLAATVGIDTFFWQKPYLIWPEFHAVWFNIVQNKSAQWGVSPAHFYFTHHLPKLLMASGPFSALGFLVSAQARRMMIPYLLYVSVISFIQHKEWRFISYVIPVFFAGAALMLSKIWPKRYNTLLSWVRRAIVVSVLAFNVLVTVLLFKISSLNYPGGHALAKLHSIVDQQSSVHVHIDSFAAMTGASLFGSLHDGNLANYLPISQSKNTWTYSKKEDISSSADFEQFSHLITANPDSHTAEDKFKIIHSQKGFSNIDRSSVADPEAVVRNLMKGIAPAIIQEREMVWILQRSDWKP